MSFGEVQITDKVFWYLQHIAKYYFIEFRFVLVTVNKQLQKKEDFQLINSERDADLKIGSAPEK